MKFDIESQSKPIFVIDVPQEKKGLAFKLVGELLDAAAGRKFSQVKAAAEDILKSPFRMGIVVLVKGGEEAYAIQIDGNEEVVWIASKNVTDLGNYTLIMNLADKTE